MELVKVLLPWVVSFLIGLLSSPFIIKELNKRKVWRKNKNTKKVLLKDDDGKISEIVNKNEKDLNTPRMGGLVIVFSTIATVWFFWIISFLKDGNVSGFLDILSRKETWLPVTAFIVGAFLGFLDDYFTVKESGKFKKGLPLRWRLVIVGIFAAFAGWWFQEKLGFSSVNAPFIGQINLGIWFIPVFILVFTSVFATSNIDGLDGLAGGIMASVYSALGFIAFYEGKFDISAFSFVIAGSLFAFLWYNIPPAKFYMSEIGYNALSFTLVIIAYLTDTVLLLPILIFPLFVTLVTTVIQVISIRFFKRRVFKVAPLHHHFEAIGWTGSQIVMRYWLISVIFSILSIILVVIS